MSRIRIKNFGPISIGRLDNEGWIEIEKVTVFIGDQASGKSTITKLISTFAWIEKALYRGDIDSVTSEEFKGEYCTYHRMSDYFKNDTEIFYEGDYYTFKFLNGVFEFYILDISKQIQVPKIMYVPAERNFLSTVKDAYEVKGLPRPLFTFQDEFERSLDEIKGILDLPIDKLRLEYDRSLKISYVLGTDYKIKLLDASSGLHSLVPLFLVTRNLSLAVANKEQDPSKSDLSVRQEQRKRAQIRDLRIKLFTGDVSDKSEEEYDREVALIESKYINSWFFNIVEEPEQNLFPTSQKEMLYSLLEYNHHERSTLIITTHSPYLINYLTLAVQGAHLYNLMQNKGDVPQELLNRLEEVVPKESFIAGDKVMVYQLADGEIKLLPSPHGFPSSKNYLNLSIAEGNNLFDQMLEIEQELS